MTEAPGNILSSYVRCLGMRARTKRPASVAPLLYAREGALAQKLLHLVFNQQYLSSKPRFDAPRYRLPGIQPDGGGGLIGCLAFKSWARPSPYTRPGRPIVYGVS